MTTETCRPSTAAAPLDGNWQQYAACAGMASDLFFPIGTTGPMLSQVEQAKHVCTSCPVRQTCLEWALETRENAGIWGGLTETERRHLHRKRTPRTREAVVVKALKPRRPAVEAVLDEYWRVEELRKAGWGRRRVAKDLGVSREALAAAEQLVAEAGSVEAALGNLAVAA